MKRSKIRLRTKLVHTSMAAWMLSGAGTHPALAATFYVNALSGDDTRGGTDAQNPDTPWKTLSRATAESLQPGDIISIAAGTYNTALGETFPINLPNGVAVVGAGKDQVILESDVASAPVLRVGGEGAYTSSLMGMALKGAGTGQYGVGLELDTSHTLDVEDVDFDESLARGIVTDSLTDTDPSLSLDIADSSFDAINSAISLSAGEADSAMFEVLLQNNTFTSRDGLTVQLTSFSFDASVAISAINNEFQSRTPISSEIFRVQGEIFSELVAQGNTFDGSNQAIMQYLNDNSTLGMIPTMVRADVQNNQFLNVHGAYAEYIYGFEGRHLTDEITIQGNTVNVASGDLFSLSLNNSFNSIPSHVDSQHKLLGNQVQGGDEFLWDYVYGSEYDHLTLALTVQGNTITGTSGEGLSILRSSFFNQTVLNDTVVIEDNSFDQIDGDVIGFSTSYAYASLIDTDLTIRNNSITNASGNGLYLTFYQFSGNEQDRHLLLEGNTITSTTEAGIYLSDNTYYYDDITAQVEIRSNDISDSQTNGIMVLVEDLDGSRYEQQLLLVDNTIGNTQESGIEYYVNETGGTRFENTALTIANNTITDTQADGIELSLSSMSRMGVSQLDVRVLQNDIERSADNGIRYQAELDDSSRLASHSEISGNHIVDAGGDGIDIEFQDSNAGARPLMVEGNHVKGAAESGILLRRNFAAGADGDLWSIRDNLVEENEGRGIFAYVDAFFEPFMLFSGNTVQNNAGGIWLNQGSTYSGYALDTFADLGGGPLGSTGQNTLTGNTGIETYDLYYSGGNNTLYAHNNRWDSTLLPIIDTKVFDNEERCVSIEGPTIPACEPGSTYEVSLSDPLSEAPTSNAKAELTAALLTDQGGEGPSPGDTFQLTAALTGTGARGCRDARFVISTPAGTEMVAGSADTSKGAITSWADGNLQVALGSLAAGETLQITWELTAAASESCVPFEIQGTLTCAEVGEVLTDDPAQEGDANPTRVAYQLQTFYADSDGDGQGDLNSQISWCQAGTPEKAVSNSFDCDDTSDSAFLGGTETCDGADNDCDGQADEGLTHAYYADTDDDGYGDEDTLVNACEAPEGFVSMAGDCDDDNDASYINAPEVCDGEDNDCNGEIDEIGDSVFFEDQDEDGYGDASSTTIACSAPVGYADQAGDCNDDSKSVSPEATETCDGVDNNCNGSIDEAEECATPTPEPGEDPSPTSTPDVVLSGGGCSCDASGSESQMPMGMASVIMGAAILTLLRRRRS
ncbi:MAG: MopE-related protein [Myxococcota bacterium]